MEGFGIIIFYIIIIALVLTKASKKKNAGRPGQPNAQNRPQMQNRPPLNKSPKPNDPNRPQRPMRKRYDKIFIYMPTWRDSQRDLFTQNFDLAKIDDVMRAQNALMLLKPHVNTVIDAGALQRFKNILFIDSHVDVYPILPYTNVLITDYSSILYDYILMKDKDVILYLYDYEEYVKERDFFAPFDENVVGKKIYDFEALCSCIEQEDYKINEEERTRIIEKFWGESMNSSPCEEIVKKISSLK